MAVLGANKSEEKTQKTATICTYLNHFELTAVGINHGIIDKKLYAEWFRGAYIRHGRILNRSSPSYAQEETSPSSTGSLRI